MANNVMPPSELAAEHPGRELAERMRWVIALRWAVAGALALVVILGRALGESTQTTAVYLGLAGLVLVYNFLCFFASRSPSFGHSSLTTLVRYGQVPVDLLVFTALVHLLGGVTSPVFVLYFVYILVGLAILPPSGAYWVAAIAALYYGALAFLEGPLGLTPPETFTQALGITPPVDMPWDYVL